MAAISPLDERAVADEVGHVAAAGVGVIDTLDAARELRMARVEAGVEHGDGAARAPARRGQCLARADIVEEPGELEVAVRGVGRVEGVGCDPHLGVALDVRHARVRPQRAGQGRTGGHRRGDHGDRRKGLGLGAERPEHARHTGDMPVRADSDEHMLRASAAGNPRQLARGARGRADVARLRQGQRHDGAGPGRAGLDAQGVAQEPAIEKVLGCIRGRAQKRAPRRAPSRAPLFASLPIVGDENAGSPTLRRSCTRRSASARSTSRPSGSASRLPSSAPAPSSAGALQELGKPPDWTYEAVFAALVGGLVGARLDFVIENWDEVSGDLLGNIFSGSGLVFFGGLLGGAIGVVLWARWRGFLGWPLLDTSAAPIAIGYTVGRLGCQLSGDGDYGVESDLPWAMAYPDGTVPTDQEVHPTPIYETLSMGLATLVLWRLRDRFAPGVLFGLYLIFAGVERFLVELIRRNDSVVAGLTQPQLLSLVMLALGGAIVAARRNAPQAAAVA